MPSHVDSIELGLAVFLHIAKQFDDGNAYPSAQIIADTLSRTEDSVNGILKRFIDADLIYETDESVRKLFPARSINKILLKDVLKVILGNHISVKTTLSSETVKLFLSSGYGTIGVNTVEDLLKQADQANLKLKRNQI